MHNSWFCQGPPTGPSRYSVLGVDERLYVEKLSYLGRRLTRGHRTVFGCSRLNWTHVFQQDRISELFVKNNRSDRRTILDHVQLRDL